MNSGELEKAWAELWPIQREVAEWAEGPLLVLAGPGSGKTRVLTCRIARLLDSTRDKAFRILGLTFTNKAADEMRSRVSRFVPGQEGRLFLGTFHSFCADVLRQHGIHVGINPNFTIYAQDNDLQSILDEAVAEARKECAVVSDLDRSLLPVIQRLKAQLIAPQDCKGVFGDPQMGERMAAVYPAYEAQLARRNSLDFNSLIQATHRLFVEFPAFAKRYRSVYPYICVDEFQDTNKAQSELIRAFTGAQYRNVFVVADDDQIIYQWNGASHQRIEEFVKEYSPRVVQLPMNFRCPPEVVDLANNLIGHNFLRTSQKALLKPTRKSPGANVVRLLPVFDDWDAEAAGVASDISDRHADHLGSVVVLARNRRLLEGVAHALESLGIPATIAQRKDEFQSSPLVWLHSVLRLANEKRDRASLESLCGAFAQMTGAQVDPDEVLTQAQATGIGFLQEWMRRVQSSTDDRRVTKVVSEVTAKLVVKREYAAFCSTAFAWIDTLVEEQRKAAADPSEEVFAGYAMEKAVWNELSREIVSSLGEDISLEAFLQELQMHSKEPAPKPNSAVLMTIHGAKGKEFDHVYLVGLVDDELPSFQSKKKGDRSPEMEEERRNCFVAITRTISTLTLSYAEKYRGWPKKPSRFLSEMGLLGGEHG